MSRTAPAQPHSSAKKMRKGIIAGIAGVALLAGGSASFATWSAKWTTSGTISSGTMSLENSWGGGVGDLSHWKLNDKRISGVASIAELQLVPGDKLTYSDKVTLKTGNRAITADVQPIGAISGDLAKDITVNFVKVTGPGGISQVWKNGEGFEAKRITTLRNDTQLEITAELTFVSSADEKSMTKTTTFTDAGIRVTQVAG